MISLASSAAPRRRAVPWPLAALALGAWLVLAAPAARAQSVEGGRLVLGEGNVWDYAESLFHEGEYYRAVSEYKRLLYYFPGGRYRLEADLRIGEAYLNGGEPKQAEAHLTDMLGQPALKPARGATLFLRSVARLELDKGEPYPVREPHIASALADLRAIPPDWPGRPRTQGFVAAMEKPPELPSKSPWLAAGLSALLPGAGSAYVGRYPEAGLAFFVNAVFIYATVDAFRQDREGLGTVLGVAALAFYGGAIYAAANGAHKYNDRARSEYLARQRVRFGLVPRPGGFTGLVEGRF